MKLWKRVILALNSRGLLDFLPDKTYLKLVYSAIMEKKLNLENPVTFNEKLQWLKLYDRNPKYTVLVDKLLVRDYIAETLGKEYLIPLLGVWDDPDEIDFDALPDKFVLKCNHNSGLGMCICTDKTKLDIQKVRDELRLGLAQNYYLAGREWPYRDVPRKIICEQFMQDSETAELRDYKLFCFDGVPKMTLVCSDRFSEKGLHEDFFDEEWNHMPMKRPNQPNSEEIIPKPMCFDAMKDFARKLSKEIPFSRIDFYEIKQKVYFGEITFFPASGFSGFAPDKWDAELGNWINLPIGGGVLNNNR